MFERQLQLVSQSSTITVDQVKSNLRVTNTDEDSLIQSYLDASVQYVEEHSGKKINQYTYDYYVPDIGGLDVAIPFPVAPVFSVDSVSYFDPENAAQTTTDYTLYQDEDHPKLAPTACWPLLYDRADAFVIRFVSGYASTIPFPENLRQAVILLASHFFETRTAAAQPLSYIPFGVNQLINLSKVGWY